MMSNQPITLRRPARRRRSRPGFTVIEMIVVVGVVILLMGIIVGYGVGARIGMKIKATKMMLQRLKAVEEEYRTQTGKTIAAIDGVGGENWTVAVAQTVNPDPDLPPGTAVIAPIDITPPPPISPDIYARVTIERFIYKTWQIDNCQTLLKASQDNLTDQPDSANPANGFYEVRDPWGTPIVYAQVNKTNHGDLRDSLKPSEGAFFVSAGPDRIFGTNPGDDGVAGTNDDKPSDDIYSNERP